MWKRDSYYKGLASAKEAGGPKEIEFSKSHVYIYNEWFWDEVLDTPDSVEDSLIDQLDAHYHKVQVPETVTLGGKVYPAFDMHELLDATLNAKERDVFDAHYIRDESFRSIAKRVGVNHMYIYQLYKRALAKLAKALAKDYNIHD